MKALLFTFVLSFVSLAGFAQGKIGHVNTQKVLDTMPSRKNAMKDIALMQTLGQQELRQKDSLIQIGMMDLEKNKNTWSPTTINYQKQRLARMDQELQYRQQELEQGLQIYSQEMNKKVTDRITGAVATVSKAKGLSYVLDENSLLFNSGGTDITAEVVKEVMRLEALDKK